MGFLPTGRLAALVLVEAVAGIEIAPPVAGEDGAVHRDVQIAQVGDAGTEGSRLSQRMLVPQVAARARDQARQ
jgi:hypothetical protein